MLVSTSVGFLHYLLEWYLCENVCVLHDEPNLKGNVKWSMPIRTEYSTHACAMWSDGGPEAWRCRLYFSMLLLVISVGRDWSVHSILEFSAMKRNLRICQTWREFFGLSCSGWLLSCFHSSL